MSFHPRKLLLISALILMAALAGCSLADCTMSDAPGAVTRLAAFPPARLLEALDRWQLLVAEPEGMPSAMPSLHLTAWFNQLILEV